MLCARGGSGLLRGESSSRAKPCRRSFSRAKSRKGDAGRAIAPVEALCRGLLPVLFLHGKMPVSGSFAGFGDRTVFFGRYRFRCRGGAKSADQTQVLRNFAQARSGRQKECGRLVAGCGGQSMPPTGHRDCRRQLCAVQPRHRFFFQTGGEALDERGFRQRRIRRSKYAALSRKSGGFCIKQRRARKMWGSASFKFFFVFGAVRSRQNFFGMSEDCRRRGYGFLFFLKISKAMTDAAEAAERACGNSLP